MIKALIQLVLEGMYLYVIKDTYGKSLGNCMLNMENLEAFLHKSGMRQECQYNVQSLGLNN